MLTPSTPPTPRNATSRIDFPREECCKEVWWVGVPVGEFCVKLKITPGRELCVEAHLDWKDAFIRGISKIECVYKEEAATIFEIFLEMVCREQRVADLPKERDMLAFFSEFKRGLTPSYPWSIKKHVIEVLRAHGKLCAKLDGISDNENFFGPADWTEFLGVDVEEFCLPPNNVGESHLCVFIPEGVTLEMVESLTLHPKKGHPCGLRNKGSSFASAFLSQHGQIPSEKNEWVLIPKEIFARRESKIGQEYQSEGYESLSAREGLIALLAMYVKTGKRHYSMQPPTYAKCNDLVVAGSMKRSVVIGGFTDQGLDITYAYGKGFEQQGVGLAKVFTAVPDAASLFRAIS